MVNMHSSSITILPISSTTLRSGNTLLWSCIHDVCAHIYKHTHTYLLVERVVIEIRLLRLTTTKSIHY